MATNTRDNQRQDPLPQGTWSVDPTQSELGFSAKGMFGLATVKGTFTNYEGELTVHPEGASGELRITAPSLDTRNPKRDKHLRSPDFFHVERYPTVTFTLTDVKPAPDGTLEGGVAFCRFVRTACGSPPHWMSPRTAIISISAPSSASTALLSGVGWSKLGMIKGPANLRAKAGAGASVLTAGQLEHL